MSHKNNTAWRLYVLIAALGLILVGLTIFGLYRATIISSRYMPLQDAMEETKVHLTQAHLWLEEYLGGDKSSIDGAFDKFEEAHADVLFMLEGGSDAEWTYSPVTDQDIRHQLKLYLSQLKTLEQLTQQRVDFPERSGPGSMLDQQYDEQFAALLVSADNAEVLLQESLRRDIRNFTIVQSSILVILIMLSVGAGVAFHLFRKHEAASRRSLEKALDRSRNIEGKLRQYESIVSSSSDMMALVDRNFTYLTVNDAYSAAFDLAEEQIVGHTVPEVFGDEVFEHEIQPQAERCLSGDEVHYEQWFDFPASGRQFMHVAYYPFTGQDKDIIGFVVNARDISRRKKSEDELLTAKRGAEDEKARSDAIVAGMGDGISIQDTDFRILYQNSVHKEMVGEHVGEFCFQAYEKTETVCSGCPLAQAFKDKEPHTSIRSIRRDDGLAHFEITASPIIDPQGNISSGVEIVRDITSRKLVEEELLSKTRQLEESQRVASIGNWEWDVVDNHVSWSDELYRIFGMEPQSFDATYEAFLRMVHPDDREMLDTTVRRSMEAGSHYHVDARMLRADGSSWMMEAIGEVSCDAEGNPLRMGGTAQDVSMRKQAEEQLRLAQFSIDSSVDAIFWINQDARIIYVNRRACEKLGYSRDELLNMSVHDIDPGFPAEAWPDHWREVRERKSFSIESEHRTRSGETFPVEVSVNFVEFEGQEYNCATARDISERRQTEETQKQLMNELVKSNAELQQFAYVASHDLQEPLRMVASYVQLLKKRYRDELDDDARDFIDYASDGAARMRLMIDDLLEYSRLDTKGHAFGSTDSEEALSVAVVNLSEAVKDSGAEITHDRLPIVFADRTQLTLVFQNLLANAIKFHGSEAPRVHVSAAKRDGEWVFSVADNGIGIDSRYQDRIFIIFKRLHSREEYPGTGIGLAVCKRIIDRHNGHIWFESEPGQGATFYFSIPEKGETTE